MDIYEKADGIIRLCLEDKDINPYIIFKKIANTEYVSIHGPEHHILDGACILTAYYNAGGKIDLVQALEKIKSEGLKIPGAICGHWGVCGAVLSVGCALSIIDGTGPLSDDGTWGKHMEYTSKAVDMIGKTYGPRCCKRDGLIALSVGIKYINEQTNIKIECDGAECTYSKLNQQCIKEKCPYYG